MEKVKHFYSNSRSLFYPIRHTLFWGGDSHLLEGGAAMNYHPAQRTDVTLR